IDRYRSLLPADSHWIRETPLPHASLPHGPLVGFAQGLRHLQTDANPADWILLLACDLPHVSSEAIEQWRCHLPPEQMPEGAIACLPKHPKGWEPLCGFYHRRCLPSLLAFVEGGGRSFQVWLQGELVEALPLTHPQILFNCNTPEDLANAQAK
ncbi:MAG: NTP transferase domain-containing protein, partial [Leptolyngbyaceae cyanobacterium SL_7_1]|nr:NTP transferase domain-containing protein [Leptolyngbyaceae cyanobacterium SL_7_1]